MRRRSAPSGSPPDDRRRGGERQGHSSGRRHRRGVAGSPVPTGHRWMLLSSDCPGEPKRRSRDGRGVDVAIEAVGIPATFALALNSDPSWRPGSQDRRHGEGSNFPIERHWINNITINDRPRRDAYPALNSLAQEDHGRRRSTEASSSPTGSPSTTTRPTTRSHGWPTSTALKVDHHQRKVPTHRDSAFLGTGPSSATMVVSFVLSMLGRVRALDSTIPDGQRQLLGVAGARRSSSTRPSRSGGDNPLTSSNVPLDAQRSVAPERVAGRAAIGSLGEPPTAFHQHAYQVEVTASTPRRAELVLRDADREVGHRSGRPASRDRPPSAMRDHSGVRPVTSVRIPRRNRVTDAGVAGAAGENPVTTTSSIIASGSSRRSARHWGCGHDGPLRDPALRTGRNRG